MSAALNPRRWFRFRLRTVLLLIALLAIPCAWIGSEWKLVHERAAMIDQVEAAGGMVTADFDAAKWLASIRSTPSPHVAWKYYEIDIKPGHEPIPISTIRRWLGDRRVNSITIPPGFPDDDEKRILDLFPDAEVTRLMQIPSDRQAPSAIAK